MIAILGAGAMGSALAVHWARHRADAVLLATEHDTAACAAWHDHQPHPALGILLPTSVPCLSPAEWEPILASADVRFGRLLGAGLTPDGALRVIGSTVEGVANTSVALALATRWSLHLPTAEAVDLALHGHLLGDEGLVVLRELFAAAVTDHHTRFTARMR